MPSLKSNTFYGTSEETYFVNQNGEIYVIQSPDLAGVTEALKVSDLPSNAEELPPALCRDLTVPDFCKDGANACEHCYQAGFPTTSPVHNLAGVDMCEECIADRLGDDAVKRLAAKINGTKGGAAKTEAKSKASAENGKKGGRPGQHFHAKIEGSWKCVDPIEAFRLAETHEIVRCSSEPETKERWDEDRILKFLNDKGLNPYQ